MHARAGVLIEKLPRKQKDRALFCVALVVISVAVPPPFKINWLKSESDCRLANGAKQRGRKNVKTNSINNSETAKRTARQQTKRQIYERA